MITSDYDPTDDAVRFLAAVMASASTDNISPKQWWPRAAAALESAASSASDFPGMVSKACRKLQIDVLGAASSAEVAALSDLVAGPRFEPFRAFCQQDTTFIVALVRARKAQARAEAAAEADEADEPAPKPKKSSKATTQVTNDPYTLEF